MKICSAALTILAVVGITTHAHAVMIFEANLTPEQVVPGTGGADPDGAGSSGTATFTLNDAQTELTYTLNLSGVILTSPFNPLVNDDVTGVHFHDGAFGVNGQHVLNVYGNPTPNDFDPGTSQLGSGILSGTWVDGDETGAAPGDSKKLSDFLTKLINGELHIQVHTIEFNSPDNTGELRGQINLVPEPASAALLTLTALPLLLRRRRPSA